MSLINQGAEPSMAPVIMPGIRKHRPKTDTPSTASPWTWHLFFLLFVVFFYAIELLYIKPVDGINDDWGMYSTLSGAYLGYSEAHVLFFLYPLSWALSKLYETWSFVPWYGIFQHAVQAACLYVVYCRCMQIRQRHGAPGAFWKPALAIACTLFFIIDLNVLSEAQYTTTAGLAAAAAVFCFITVRCSISTGAFLAGCIPAFIFAWISFSMRQNIFYLMLPIAGMLWLAKWLNAYRNGYDHIAHKLLGFALILLAGMGILYGLNAAAYSSQEWKDFRKINHYRERVGDFYTWPEYAECAGTLEELGISEEEYMYMRNGAPYIGHGMSVEDWKQMHDIAKDCYLARVNFSDRLKNVAIGGISVFFYEDGMQPANVLALLLMAATLFLILLHQNFRALFVFALYFAGRTVSWFYVLYEGRFPKRIIQPLITMDYAVLFGILLAFNLLRLEHAKRYTVILPVLFALCAGSLVITKNNIDANYHAHQKTWEELKAYCRAHPDNLYIWTYASGTLENYCESPFDMTLDTYNNFVYTNWGVILNPNTRTKLSKYGVENFGQDLVDSDRTYFILQDAPYNEEHPVIMYFRHTYNVSSVVADTFTAGDTVYMVYQLRK